MLYLELEKFSLPNLKTWGGGHGQLIPYFMRRRNEFVAIKTWWFESLLEGSQINQFYPNDLRRFLNAMHFT